MREDIDEIDEDLFCDTTPFGFVYPEAPSVAGDICLSVGDGQGVADDTYAPHAQRGQVLRYVELKKKDHIKDENGSHYGSASSSRSGSMPSGSSVRSGRTSSRYGASPREWPGWNDEQRFSQTVMGRDIVGDSDDEPEDRKPRLRHQPRRPKRARGRVEVDFDEDEMLAALDN